jgi:hypothetical protein
MEKWEYEAYIYDWGAGELEVRRSGLKQGLTWAGMWNYFNDLGEEGWEMLSATSIADARWGNPDSNTTRMLFAFKRRKPHSTSASSERSPSS